MKNGFKIWDTDTHVRPTLETLEPFYDAALSEALRWRSTPAVLRISSDRLSART